MARDDRNSSARGEGAIMPFGDHLEELRRRVMLALAVPIPLAVLVFLVADRVRAILIAPLLEALGANGLPQHLQALSPTETMAVDIKLAFVTAIVLSAPWILWQAWKFIEPGLYEHERRFARLLIPGSIALVLAGIATLYWVLLPFSLQVLVAYGMDTPPPPPAWVAGAGPSAGPEAGPSAGPDAGTGGIPTLTESPAEVRPGQAWIKLPERTLCVAIDPGGGLPAEVLTVPLARGGGAYIQEYRLGEYISFVLLMMLGIAIAYQTPLVILLLGWVGIVRPETLSRNRRYALLIIAIVAAVVTPTSDLLSMSLMMVPLYLLYELGILLLKIAPPSAVGEGAVFRGFWRRLRSRGEA